MNVSILILTRNEEASLPACLQSVEWSDDIVVFDSYSNDRTVEIAKAAGARVIQRAFDNERDQRTASLQVDFKHPWVYNPDADEITPPELKDEILSMTDDAARPEVAFRVRFKTIFRGKWIGQSSLYPTWVVRLFRPSSVSFERLVNLRYVIHGPESRLQNHFEHHAFDKGISAWIDKHNRYSTQEAIEGLQSLTDTFEWRNLFARSPVLRRRALKEFSFRLPFRPTLRFLYMYVGRLGFLDGQEGFDYCVLLSVYERMIVFKMDELRRAKKEASQENRSVSRVRLILPLSCLILMLVASALIFSDELLCVESRNPKHADVIIVLGGESDPRAQQAAELFRDHLAPRIIVSGDGDADYIARDLEQAGISPAVIELEVLSRNTKENAQFTSRLLKRSGVRRAIIVTSWFHSRRALNAFCHFAPGIEFSSEPVPPGSFSAGETVHVFQEYLKTVWYFFRYGIPPWRTSGP
jgi:uncharacterized SAM-binding protein YcdF (DUF218 family)